MTDAAAPPPEGPVCLRCGSLRIVPGLELLDHYGDAGGFSKAAEVQVHGKPGGWFFKDTTAGKLSADVCGDCGYVELTASNHAALYAKYVQVMTERVQGDA